MKAFTDRNPRKIGFVALAVMAGIVGAVLLLNRSVFSSTYPIRARFADAAGIGPGAKVLVAGVPVGSVGAVTLDGNGVVMHLNIDHGVVLPAHTSAAVKVETLLGVVDVTLQPTSGWHHPLHPGALITTTAVPVQVYQLQNTAGKLANESDVAALNSVVVNLAAVTKGKQVEVGKIIDGLAKLTTTVDVRRGEVGQLLQSADSLSSTLQSRETDLSSMIANLSTVVDGLAQHSGDLGALIDNTEAVAAQTSSLIGGNQPQLDSLLKNLHVALNVLAAHQLDLAQGVAYLASGVRGFSSIGYSGPADTPNSWANIFTNPVGLSGGYGALGPCGAFDQALNVALGPDPLACNQQTGPLPGASAPAASSAPAQGVAGGGSRGGSPNAPGGGAGAASAAPDDGVDGLASLFGAVAGGAP